MGLPVGAPSEIAGRIVVPGAGGHVLVATFDVSRRFQRRADVGEAVFMSGPTVFVAGDFLARTRPGGELSVVEIDTAGSTTDGEAFYLLDDPFAAEPAVRSTAFGRARYGMASSGMKTGSTSTIREK